MHRLTPCLGTVLNDDHPIAADEEIQTGERLRNVVKIPVSSPVQSVHSLPGYIHSSTFDWASTDVKGLNDVFMNDALPERILSLLGRN
jgi:hypothetical protein